MLLSAERVFVTAGASCPRFSVAMPEESDSLVQQFTFYVYFFIFRVQFLLTSAPLSKLPKIKLSDLFGCIILTPPRESPAVDMLCNLLAQDYPQIQIAPLPAFYTASTFSEHQDDILLTRDSFQTISSAFRTIEVDWNFSSPTGIICSLHPEPKVAEFIFLLEQESKNLPF